MPRVAPLRLFTDCLPDFGQAPTVFFYEKGGESLGEFLRPDVREVNIIIGPEGGFSEEEAEAAAQAGAFTATMGKRVLRTETAPAAALALVMYLTGNMEPFTVKTLQSRF